MKTIRIKKSANNPFQVIEKQDIISQLFQKYEDIGFIYPAKKKLLQPHFAQIKHNWQKLINTPEKLLWVINHQESKDQKNFASITAWQQSNYGLIAQHLVSTGNPFLSLKVMLEAQYRAEHFFDENQVKSSQNWFRPNNRYAYRIFASMYDKLGAKKASLLLFQYLHLPISAVAKPQKNKFAVEEITQVDEQVLQFVTQQYGEVFAKAEELHLADIQQVKLGSIFQKYGLNKYRKVIVLKEKRSKKIVATLIANRTPLGLNFSFLENRAYYILDKTLSELHRTKVLEQLNSIAQSVYQDFELASIPIVTDKVSGSVLQNQKAIMQREYMQSIWLREGFAEWYAHIDSFLKRIERRQ